LQREGDKLKLEVAVTDVSQSKKDLSIEVPADQVKAEFDKAYDAYARYAKVPGFRPGRVPLSVVKQRFSKDVKDEVIGRLLPHALQHAIVDHKLRVVGEPSIIDFSVNEGEPLKFKVSVEIVPEFELQEYKGLKATKRVVRVTDEDVENVIGRWRERAAEFVPVEDRPSQNGDFVSVNLVGKYVEPKEEGDLKADDVQIELGAEGVQPEFGENLIGVVAGDVREFRVSYPEDFGSKGLSGKTLDFIVTVMAVRQKELPELNDDFAQEFGEYESIQQMREQVRQDLEKEADRVANAKLREDLLGQILNSYDFEVPASLVDKQAADRTRELAYYLMRSGMPPQSVKEINWEERLNEARPQAVRDVRAALLVGRISDAEGLEISKEEIDAEIGRIAASTGEPVELLKDRLTKDEALSSIENRLRYQKALDLVVDNAEITVEELTEKEDSELEAVTIAKTEAEVSESQAAL
jgi:trigger factor